MVSTSSQLPLLLPADGQQRTASVRQRTPRSPGPRALPSPEGGLRDQPQLILYHIFRRARQEARLRGGVGAARQAVGDRLEESQLPKVAGTAGKLQMIDDN